MGENGQALLLMIDIRPMAATEEAAVRRLFADCHPAIPTRPPGWYVVYPTIVALLDGTVVGFTSFSVSPNPNGLLTLYGNDLCVAETVRRRGIGQELATARATLARAVGATCFIGVAERDNAPMRRIFARQGAHPCQVLRGYWQGRDAEVWTGLLS